MNSEMVVDEEAMVDAAASFAQASEPDVPQIEPPGSGHLTLMWGVEGEDGVRLRKAEVRELNGADEEAMARLDQNSPAYFTDLVDLVLRRAVVSVGEETIVPSNGLAVLGDLIAVDRDLLFKEIIVATFGSQREYENIKCPNCDEGNDIEVDVEGLIAVEELEGEPVTSVTLRDGREVALHYPTGKDQKYTYDSKEALSVAEYNTRMIGRCIDTVDGAEVLAQQAQNMARKFGMADRRKIVTALAGGPSVKFKEVEVPCTECGEAIPFAFGWADLLWV